LLALLLDDDIVKEKRVWVRETNKKRKQMGEYHALIQENKDKKGLKILDAGTGSGCIAIALEKQMACKRVVGVDISKSALSIARKNLKLNKSSVYLKRRDIIQLAEKRKGHTYDIIVSNPPYVTHSEKKQMHPNVLNHEPHEALFVNDSNPLMFYEAICKYAKRTRKKEVFVYFEINEKFGLETFNLLIGHKFDEVILQKDMNGKERMLKGIYRNYM
jgi:release factor glutamine methyltransferase